MPNLNEILEKENTKISREGNKFYWNGRLLGWLSEDKKRFITYRYAGHFFVKYRGFGFNRELIGILEKEGVEKIILFYKKQTGGETLFITTPKIVRERGNLVKEKGFEEQYILNISYFEKK